MLDDGETFETVERDVIAGAQLHEDDKAALWLYAWSLTRRADGPF